MKESELGTATRAAWLYYVGGYTQAQIARRLNVSSAKAHRLLALAHRSGHVKVFVEGLPAECAALEERLTQQFRLKYCSVIPAVVDSEAGAAASFTALGVGGARFLYQYLENSGPTVIGIGQGRTLAATADRLPHFSHPNMRFVALLGGLTRKLAASPFDTIYRLAERTGGEGYFLPTPLIADSVADCEVLWAQKSVQRVLALARQCELYLISIGDMGPHAFMREIGMITAAEYQALGALGAKGDLLAQFLDADGRLVDCEMNQRSVSLRIHELEGREVVAIAGGLAKTEAIAAALHSGMLTGLVTDEVAAHQILARERAAASQPAV
ncbi:MAG: sugar-binding transcriptional regulator [Pseudomonadota bacterium]|nr:sugar-binding transcriptional regulator [Pseudomonadota bacterium]